MTRGSASIPRRGLRNRTLEATLGVAVEPYGEVTRRDGRDFVSGRSSWFGGPGDGGVTATETGALTGERLRALNPAATPAEIRANPRSFYFAAMRFDYAPGKTVWRDARLLVVNPRTGRAVVVRCVDWGPNTRTKRTVDLSPQAMADLGLSTDGEALVAFATDGAALGPVR